MVTVQRAARATTTVRDIAVVLALWIPIAALFAVLLFVQADGAMPVWAAIRSAIRMATVPAAFSVAIWYLSGRLPWPEGRTLRFVIVHVVIGAAFAVIAAVWSIWPLFGGVRGIETWTLLHSVLPWQVASNFFLYGLVAGLSYAIRGAWSAREGRVLTERAERLRAQAELAALRAHINPHFLFNTLHSVTQLVRSDPARAEGALERLSDLFRYALRLDREQVELVSLEEEWRFTERYLWLEQMRMGDRLHVQADLSDDALACTVPPFTLQPLVENAIRHGVAPKPRGGTIRIHGHERDGVLHLEVADDGMGADAAAITGSAGVGIRAVRQRLEARHGARADVRVDADQHGVRIALALPAQLA